MSARITMTRQMASVQLVAHFTVGVKRDGRSRFVSWCPALDIYSQGPTQDKALKNIREAVQLFVLDCLERGTLEQVLRECGFRPQLNAELGKNQLPAAFKEARSIKVPIPFILEREGNQCHA